MVANKTVTIEDIIAGAETLEGDFKGLTYSQTRVPGRPIIHSNLTDATNRAIKTDNTLMPVIAGVTGSHLDETVEMIRTLLRDKKEMFNDKANVTPERIHKLQADFQAILDRKDEDVRQAQQLYDMPNIRFDSGSLPASALKVIGNVDTIYKDLEGPISVNIGRLTDLPQALRQYHEDSDAYKEISQQIDAIQDVDPLADVKDLNIQREKLKEDSNNLADPLTAYGEVRSFTSIISTEGFFRDIKYRAERVRARYVEKISTPLLQNIEELNSSIFANRDTNDSVYSNADIVDLYGKIGVGRGSEWIEGELDTTLATIRDGYIGRVDLLIKAVKEYGPMVRDELGDTVADQLQGEIEGKLSILQAVKERAEKFAGDVEQFAEDYQQFKTQQSKPQSGHPGDAGLAGASGIAVDEYNAPIIY